MYVGASVLELSKLHVLNFHYNYIKENIQARSVADQARVILCGSGHATTAAIVYRNYRLRHEKIENLFKMLSLHGLSRQLLYIGIIVCVMKRLKT